MKTLKKRNILICIFTLLIISACTANRPLKKAANEVKKGECNLEKYAALLSITPKNVGRPIPKNVRFTGAGVKKIKGQHKKVPKTGRITLNVDKKGYVTSLYCG